MAKQDKKSVGNPRPFLKWVGGKGRLIHDMSQYFPETYNRYFEPFVGGGAMFFSLNPDKSYINDMNVVLMNAYIHIRDDVERLIKDLSILEAIFYELPNVDVDDSKKEFYLKKRVEYNQLSSDDFKKTSLLIFLNKTCFNGLYRENSKGGFNVPFGQHNKPTICDEENLRAISTRLKKTTISHGSYENVIKKAKAGDFIYLDPPYYPINSASFTAYHASGFVERDQEILRDNFKKLAEMGCYVMLSNSDAPFINELYKDFTIHKIYAARSVNSVGTKRGKIAEVLVTSY